MDGFRLRANLLSVSQSRCLALTCLVLPLPFLSAGDLWFSRRKGKSKGQKYKNTGDEEKLFCPYILWLEKRRFLIVKLRFLM